MTQQKGSNISSTRLSVLFLFKKICQSYRNKVCLETKYCSEKRWALIFLPRIKQPMGWFGIIYTYILTALVRWQKWACKARSAIKQTEMMTSAWIFSSDTGGANMPSLLLLVDVMLSKWGSLTSHLTTPRRDNILPPLLPKAENHNWCYKDAAPTKANTKHAPLKTVFSLEALLILK